MLVQVAVAASTSRVTTSPACGRAHRHGRHPPSPPPHAANARLASSTRRASEGPVTSLSRLRSWCSLPCHRSVNSSRIARPATPGGHDVPVHDVEDLGQDRVVGVCVDDGLLVEVVDAAFVSGEEAASGSRQLRRRSTKHQAAAIGRRRIHRPSMTGSGATASTTTGSGARSTVTGVATGLGALCGDDVDAHVGHTPCPSSTVRTLQA